MASCLILTLMVGLTTAAITPTTDPNMNGEYLLAPTPKGKTTWSTNFKDYPGGVEYFEVYAGPVNSTYGEVFWTSLPTVKLPDDIVKRFKSKGMAVVGFEVDQVRKGAGPNGEDVSVPINCAYNHHYGATLLGSGSSMKRVPYDPHCPWKATNCSASLLTPEPGFDRIAVEHTPSPNGLPTNLWCGEFRKSYHAIPPPYAQIIESPSAFAMTPMQIDTWNRDKMSLTAGPFVPGPHPKKANRGHWPDGSIGRSKWPSGSLAPDNGTDAIYSGLLECPLTSRIRKQLTGGGWNDSFSTNIACSQAAAVCPKKLDTAQACFDAAKNVGIDASAHVTTEQGSSADLPSGCSVQVNTTTKTAHVYFNTNAKSAACCGAGVDTVKGTASTDLGDSLGVTLGLTVSDNDGVTITISGPSDGNWFGIGFNTHFMANSPYSIVVDGEGKVTEHVLADHAAGTLLNSSVKVVSHSVANGERTVVMTRALKGLTPQHHDFDAQQLSMDFISAVGSTPTFSYHKSKGVGTLALWPETPATSKGGSVGFFGANVATYEMRNDWNGEVGYGLVAAQRLNVTELGRAAPGGQALKAAAKVNLWSAATKKLLASAAVGPGAGVEANGYAYAPLATPVVLEAGQEYYVTQTCSLGMPDKWTNSDENARSANAQLATLKSGIYSNQGHPGVCPSVKPVDPKQAKQFSGIVNFKASVPPPPKSRPTASCVCSVPAAEFGKGTGTIKYLGGPAKPDGETIGFPPRCEPFPRETVLRDKNPTCDIRTYVGGLSTCHHGWHLLDADQEVPWQDKPLVYHFKWRWYFQEYDAKRHVSAYGWNTGIGGNTAEYDVPQCPAGTPVEKCTHEISGTVVGPGKSTHFIGAHYHCHAPTCISMEIYNNNTGELLCREEPYHGQGATDKDRFDEAGYIAQRICLWGNETYGLEKPPLVSGVPLFIRAVTNSTYGHHGEMALPQMLVADLPA